MSPSTIRRKVQEEIAMIPDEKIAKLFDLVHHFRRRARPSENAERIMSLAGSWTDMPEAEYASFVSEIEERRHRAGTRTRSRGTGSD